MLPVPALPPFRIPPGQTAFGTLRQAPPAGKGSRQDDQVAQLRGAVPRTEPGGEFASPGFGRVDVITFGMEGREEWMKPEQCKEGDDGDRGEDPGPNPTGSGVVKAPFDAVKDAGKGGETHLPLEEAEEDGLGDAACLAGGKGIADVGTEDDGDGDEADAETGTDPEGEEEQGGQAQHGVEAVLKGGWRQVAGFRAPLLWTGKGG
jgi:hypothetical protein